MIPFRDDNPTRSFPVVTVGLLAANIVVYLYQIALPRPEDQLFVYTYGAVPVVVLGRTTLAQLLQAQPPFPALEPAWLAIFTSMFLHGGFFHLAGNMLYLWVFGNNVEDLLGHGRFIVFYFLCGLLAAGAQILLSLGSVRPMIGASGAIAGVLGAYYVKFPHARVHCLIFLLFFITVAALPAGLVLFLWFLLQLFQSLSPGAFAGQGGIAVFAHIGGFVAGWALVRRFEPRRRLRRLSGWPY